MQKIYIRDQNGKKIYLKVYFKNKKSLILNNESTSRKNFVSFYRFLRHQKQIDLFFERINKIDADKVIEINFEKI